MDPYRYAPPPTVVDSLFAVPIHIEAVTGTIVFDGGTKTATADAEMQFTVGPDAGYPIFDLRQTIATAELDGTSVPPADMEHHNFGGGVNAQLRVIERWLDAGTTHTLVLGYPLGEPNSPNARDIVWEADPPASPLIFSSATLTRRDI